MCTPYSTPISEPCLLEILSNLCGFSTACFSNYNEYIVIDTGLKKFFFELENRQTLFLLFDGKITGFEIFSRLRLDWGNLFSKFGEILDLVFILLLPDLSPLFGILQSVHSFTVKCSFWVFDYAHRG